jgi:hypothetical protein
MADEAATVETSEVAIPEFDLSPETEQEVEQSVLSANAGKAKDELLEQIQAAKEAKRTELIEANKPILAKAAELKALPENKDKSDDELYELAQDEVEKANPNAGAFSATLDDDFFGVGKPSAGSNSGQGAKSAPAIPEELKPEWEEVQSIKQDPVAAIYLKAKKEGKVRDFMDLLGSLPPDPDKLSPEKIKEMEIRHFDPNISEDDLQEVLEEFKEKKTFEKIKDVSAFAAQLRQIRQSDLQLLEGKVTASTAATREAQQRAMSEAQRELNDTLKGKVFYGVTITDQVANSVLSTLRQTGISFAKPDGSLDVQRAITSVLRENHFHDMLQAAYDRGVKQASKKEAIKRGKPLTGLRARTSIPSNQQKNTRQEVDEIIKRKMGGAK